MENESDEEESNYESSDSEYENVVLQEDAFIPEVKLVVLEDESYFCYDSEPEINCDVEVILKPPSQQIKPKTETSQIIPKKTIVKKKRHTCPFCGKTFHLKYHLTVHVRIHTGERPYVCKTCQKAFTQKHSLTIHERIHTGFKPYSCPVCHKKFSQSSSLKSHTKVHEQIYFPNKGQIAL